MASCAHTNDLFLHQVRVKKKGSKQAQIAWKDVRKQLYVKHNVDDHIQRYTVRNLLGDTEYKNVSIIAINSEGFRSEQSNALEIKTLAPSRLQLLQNELVRTRNHPADLIDMHFEIFKISQRVDRNEYLKQLLRLLNEEVDLQATVKSLNAQHAEEGGEGEEGEEEHPVNESEDANGHEVSAVPAQQTKKQKLAQLKQEQELQKKEEADKQGEEKFPNYMKRKLLFQYRLKMLAQEIKSADDTRIAMLGRQSELVHKMQATQQKLGDIVVELDRVSRFQGSMVDSSLIHGKMQRFPKDVLRDQLQQEQIKQQAFIGSAKVRS
jgi:hypothetical protein